MWRIPEVEGGREAPLDYSVLAQAGGERVVYYAQFGGRNGDWVLLSRVDDMFTIRKGWYGSCAGCDVLRMKLGTSRRKVDPKKLAEVAEEYPTFLDVPASVMLAVTLDGEEALKKLLPGNSEIAQLGGGRALTDMLVCLKMDLELQLTGQDVLAATNQTIRRQALIECGNERFCKDVGAELVDEDKGGRKLLRVLRPGARPVQWNAPRTTPAWQFLECLDPSTGSTYMLQVPPDVQTAKEAVAWTFNMQPAEWGPKVET